MSEEQKTGEVFEKLYGGGLEKFEKRNGTPPAPAEQNTFLATIERLSLRPEIDVTKIEKIMEMQERILDRNAKQAFNAAMTRTQNRIEFVVAKVWNDQTKSHYSDLKTILVNAKPVYTEEGFSLMFYEGETTKESHKRICVDILHEQGHTEKRWGDFAVQTTGIAGKAMMTQIHGEGSAFSYGRRYLTCAVFNIPTGDDDDGQKAGKPETEFITKPQAEEISKLITDKNIDINKWLKTNSLETVDTMPANKFDRAKRSLESAAVRKPAKKELGD